MTVPFDAADGPAVATDRHDLRGLLSIAPFRRLWVALSLSSLGDWLGLLATSSLATEVVHGYSAKTYALGGVLFVRLLPALVFGPLAGALADRLDRRKTMVVCDVARFALFISIAVFHNLYWLLGASFLVETASLLWIPAKEASVPNLVPRQRLEAANQLSLLTTYGSAPVASVIFALISLINSALAAAFPFFKTNPVDLALYFDAATFLFSAATIVTLRQIGGRRVGRPTTEGADRSEFTQSIVEGWRFVARDPLLRGILVGLLGAFAAGGTVVALGRVFVLDLHAGNAGYGVLFGTLFLGLAAGMFLGPRLLGGFSRRRLLGLSILASGVALTGDALSPTLSLAVVCTFWVGAFAGVAWVVGYTLVGKHVDDELRGRTFAFLFTLMRVDLLAVLAISPLVAGVIGAHELRIAHASVRFDGATIVLLVSGLLAVAVGFASYRQLDDRRGVSVWSELRDSLRGRHAIRAGTVYPGRLVAFEGGDGAGKSTQAALLADWLRERGYDVVSTHEPGATRLGGQVRGLLLDPATGQVSARAEALLYGADRAEHLMRVILPAIQRGAIVVTDRYVDSSLSYQGVGRGLGLGPVADLVQWVTGGLVPDLTVLLDVPTELGRARTTGAPDRVEGEPPTFHERVRSTFRELAAASPDRYLLLDASGSRDELAEAVRSRIVEILPERPDASAAPTGKPSAVEPVADPARR